MQAVDILREALEVPRSRQQLIDILTANDCKTPFADAIRQARATGVDIEFIGRPGRGERGYYVANTILPKGILQSGKGYKYRLPNGRFSKANTLDDARRGLMIAWA